MVERLYLIVFHFIFYSYLLYVYHACVKPVLVICHRIKTERWRQNIRWSLCQILQLCQVNFAFHAVQVGMSFCCIQEMGGGGRQHYSFTVCFFFYFWVFQWLSVQELSFHVVINVCVIEWQICSEFRHCWVWLSDFFKKVAFSNSLIRSLFFFFKGGFQQLFDSVSFDWTGF